MVPHTLVLKQLRLFLDTKLITLKSLWYCHWQILPLKPSEITRQSLRTAKMATFDICYCRNYGLPAPDLSQLNWTLSGQTSEVAQRWKLRTPLFSLLGPVNTPQMTACLHYLPNTFLSVVKSLDFKFYLGTRLVPNVKEHHHNGHWMNWNLVWFLENSESC